MAAAVRGRPGESVRVADRQVWRLVANRAPDAREVLTDAIPAKAQAVMTVLLKMTKLEIAPLQRAYDQA